MVLEQTGGRVPKVVGIEGGPDRQSQNLPGIGILYNDGSIQGMGAFERGIESPLGHELDIFIDGEDQVSSRVRFTLLAVQHMPASIERCEHAAGNTMQVAVELAL